MTAHHVYFSVQGVQALFPDPLIERVKADELEEYEPFERPFIFAQLRPKMEFKHHQHPPTKRF